MRLSWLFNNFLWAIFLFAAPVLQAADIIGIDLVMDGSSEPPGDLINMEIILEPNEHALELMAKAYRLSEDKKKIPIPCAKETDAKFCDEKKNLSQSIKVFRDVTPLTDIYLKSAAFVFPYATFEIAKGEHEVFYELEARMLDKSGEPLIFAGKEVWGFSTHTRLTTMVIKDTNRSELVKPVGGPPKIGEAITPVIAYMSIEGETELKQKDTVITVETKTASSDEPTRVAVNIPRSFERDHAIADKPISLDKFVPQSERVIYFATNRKEIPNAKNPGGRFGIEAGNLTYGSASVNIPITKHKLGHLETSWWGNDRDENFIVDAVNILRADDFGKSLAPRDTLVYAHGFRNSFADALHRTAQFQHDMRFPGKSVAFSFPSAGNGLRYDYDESTATASVAPMMDFLMTLTKGKGGNITERTGKIFMIAHSMGCRILLRALNRLSISGYFSENAKPFAHIIFAAPDVDALEFATAMPAILKIANSVTYYYSTLDGALGLSAKKHGIDRIGLHPYFITGMNTINVDATNSIFKSGGHSYFAGEDRVIFDIGLSILAGLKPEKRRPPLNTPAVLPNFEPHPHFTFASGGI